MQLRSAAARPHAQPSDPPKLARIKLDLKRKAKQAEAKTKLVRDALPRHADDPSPATECASTHIESQQDLAQSTATDHLLRLCAELRNAIYHLVLVNNSPVILSQLKRHENDLLYQHEAYNLATQPGLLRTCHQIRNEATAIFYGGNIFQSNRRGPVVAWLSTIGAEKRSMVRQIRGFAVDSAWATIMRAKGRSEWFEMHMDGLGMSIPRGVVRSPCVEAEWPDLMNWVDSAGGVLAEPKKE
ncbi:hypothetical protein LTR85_005360 [Meristemomyces frigidus]|nr:hypothetical protein LTR85_005360 [Meristemomyces frigidus]